HPTQRGLLPRLLPQVYWPRTKLLALVAMVSLTGMPGEGSASLGRIRPRLAYVNWADPPRHNAHLRRCVLHAYQVHFSSSCVQQNFCQRKTVQEGLAACTSMLQDLASLGRSTWSCEGSFLLVNCIGKIGNESYGRTTGQGHYH